LRRSAGHIGYGIRPDRRRMGYATLLLGLSLKEAAQLGIGRVRVTCSAANTASEKVIIKNGGVFDSQTISDKEAVKRFWIENPWPLP